MTDLIKLKTEIDADPLARGYAGMNDDAVATSLSAIDRPDTVSIKKILRFLILENTYKTDGGDTQNRSIWQRMKEVVAMAEVPGGGAANPWGSAALGNVSEIQQVKTHTLFDLFTLSAQGNLSIDLVDTNFKNYLAGAQEAGCMSAVQETALLALGDSLQSRAQELGLGSVNPRLVNRVRIT